MKLIAEISSKSLGIGLSEQFGQSYKLRKSARAVLFNSAGEVGVQHITKFNHHKLSGGGGTGSTRTWAMWGAVLVALLSACLLPTSRKTVVILLGALIVAPYQELAIWWHPKWEAIADWAEDLERGICPIVREIHTK
jgi:hypothetical protein